MKKRLVTSLVAGGLMAAMLPAAAAAQTDGQGTLTFAFNATCEFGQGSSLPACEVDEGGTVITLTFSNPAERTGAFDGVQVLNGTMLFDTAANTFEGTGPAFFAGEVEGCGVGTVLMEYAGAATIGEDGAAVFEMNGYTIVPGGTLPVIGTIDESGTETVNGDGTSTLPYSVTYSCEEA